MDAQCAYNDLWRPRISMCAAVHIVTPLFPSCAGVFSSCRQVTWFLPLFYTARTTFLRDGIARNLPCHASPIEAHPRHLFTVAAGPTLVILSLQMELLQRSGFAA